jgi:hypothetical protein
MRPGIDFQPRKHFLCNAGGRKVEVWVGIDPDIQLEEIT